MDKKLTYPQFITELFACDDVKAIMSSKAELYGHNEFYSSSEKQHKIYDYLLLLFSEYNSREEFIEKLKSV